MKASVSILLSSLLASLAAQAEKPLDYNFDIKPILSDRCFLCHGFDEKHRSANLRLDTPEGAFTKRDGVTPIVPGHPEKSDIWRRITSTDPELVMPTPESHLTLNEKEKSLIKRWIEEGANYKEHWAFIPPERPATPEVQQKDWVKNPIDAFVLAKLEEHQLKPSAPAEPITLARRVSLDLVGLPHQSDLTSPEAQISELLASKHFGERWTLPWLDASRYADSNGFQGDANRFAFPWRDWMIRSLNSNRPQDKMIVEMLAGDMLENPTQDQLIATAFNRHHQVNDEGGAIEAESIFNYRVDRVDTAATTFLGLTFACAQCHDHKYDPITQKDYFSFMAFFSNMKEDGPPRVRRRSSYHYYKIAQPVITLENPELKAQWEAVKEPHKKANDRLKKFQHSINKAENHWVKTVGDAELAKLPELLRAVILKTRGGTPRLAAEKKRLREHFVFEVSGNEKWNEALKEFNTLDHQITAIEEKMPVVMVMKELNRPATQRLRNRGSYDQPVGDPIPAGLPSAFSSFSSEKAQNRLTLARWMVSKENPLTARVLVNRTWQEIFGVGLVKTPEDFGFQGALPSHPDLLDWLAVEFIESGWDFKKLIYLIVSSNTYQQSSKATPEKLEVDPTNKLLARGPRFRLSSLLIRDQALSVAGLLDPKFYGPPTYPKQPEGMWLDVSFGNFYYPTRNDSGNQYRRSLYTFWRRTLAPPNMFDTANRQMCVVKPSRTNTPLQALTLLNDEIYVTAARALAIRSHQNKEAIQDIFKTVTSRLPLERELQILQKTYDREFDYYKKNSEAAKKLALTIDSNTPRVAALTIIAQMVLNLDETVTKE